MSYFWVPDMDSRVLATAAIGLPLIAYFSGRGIRKFLAEPLPPLALAKVTSSDPALCAQIVACTGYDNTGAKNLFTNVKSRAIPNQRLVRAFEIDNSFTTSEGGRRKEFNLEAGKAIKMTEAKWQDVARVSKELICQASFPSKLTTAGHTAPIALDSLASSVCLKVVLHVLFGEEPLELDDDIIATITKSINSLWIQSKRTGTPTKSDKDALQEALVKILPGLKWSARSFVQVNFVKPASPMMRSVLARFLANPTVTGRNEYVHDSEASAVSVDHIVREILRLYPSVKRVYRQFHMDNKLKPEDLAADIEACQRTEALWGADAQRFVPSRWIHASDEARNSYLAFGHLPFTCPAKAEFGPMMIGILVAALVDHFSPEDWYLNLGEGSSGVAQRSLEKALNGEEPLVSDRRSFEGIEIVRT